MLAHSRLHASGKRMLLAPGEPVHQQAQQQVDPGEEAGVRVEQPDDRQEQLAERLDQDRDGAREELLELGLFEYCREGLQRYQS